MSVRKQYSNTRTIIDYNNVVGEIGESVLICVDKGVIGIARKLLAERGLWASTYAVSVHDDYYLAPDSHSMDVISNAISQFLGATNTMNCNDFIDALNSIALAINTNNCCGSVGGAGSTDVPATTGGGTGSYPGNHGTGDPPAGFATWAEYDTYKCDMATKIVDDMIADMAWLSGAGVLSSYVTVLTATLLTPIPFDDIIAVSGLLVALAAQFVLSTELTDVKTALENNKGDFVCALFNAQTPAQSRSQFEAEMTTHIADSLLETLLGYWLSNYRLNSLYEDNPAERAKGLPVGTCSCICGINDLWGGGYTDNQGSVAVTSYQDGATYRAAIEFDCPVTLTYGSAVGQSATGYGNYDFEIGTSLTNYQDLYGSDTEPAGSSVYSGVGYIGVISLTPFTLNFSYVIE